MHSALHLFLSRSILYQPRCQARFFLQVTNLSCPQNMQCLVIFLSILTTDFHQCSWVLESFMISLSNYWKGNILYYLTKNIRSAKKNTYNVQIMAIIDKNKLNVHATKMTKQLQLFQNYLRYLKIIPSYAVNSERSVCILISMKKICIQQ